MLADMPKKKAPAAVTEYFRQLGKKYGSKAGKIGGKRSLETMTPAERTARAKKAAARRVAQSPRCETEFGVHDHMHLPLLPEFSSARSLARRQFGQ
jgi:hypothetical protein